MSVIQKNDLIWRSPTDPVILSTIPHFLSLLFVTKCKLGQIMNIYAVIILISSLLSLVWHFQKEPKNIFFWLDYGFALVWVFIEFIVAILTAPIYFILTIAFFNIIILFTNKFVDFLDYNGFVSYEYGHTTWHLLSCLKSIFISYMLGCYYNM